MTLPWITDAQIADATAYGHVFDIGQFRHDPSRKRELDQQCQRGEMVKVRAMWPGFTCGTCVKTCYVRTGRVHNPSPAWHAPLMEIVEAAHAAHHDATRPCAQDCPLCQVERADKEDI
jgi:hypothetical protein